MAYRSRYAAPDPGVRRRASRLRIFLPTLVLLVLFGALAGFWAFATWRAGAEMDSWLEREARLGRQWTCPNRQIGGFPFRIEVICDKPTFSGRGAGRELTGGMRRVMAVAQLQAPSHVIMEADGPLTMASAEGDRLQLEWELLRASVEGRPGASLRQFSLEMTKPRLTVTGFGLPDSQAQGEMVDLHIRRTPDRPDSDGAYDIASRGTRLLLPVLEPLLGSADPIDADIVSTVLKAEPLAGGIPAQELERWRQAGGTLQLTRLALSQGQRRIDASGALGIDELHRPQGRLDVTVSGLDDVLRRFGLGPRAANLGGLLAGILGGGKAQAAPQPDSPAGPRGLTLPLRLADGKASLGPLPVARLLPLY